MARRRRRQEVALQTTIMVDVLFILLIFFILVSRIRQTDVDVDLPQLAASGDKQAVARQPAKRLRVAIDARGGLFVDGKPQSDLATLRARLAAAGARGPDGKLPAVNFRTDKQARSGVTIQVIHLLAELGYDRVHFEALAAEGAR